MFLKDKVKDLYSKMYVLIFDLNIKWYTYEECVRVRESIHY